MIKGRTAIAGQRFRISSKGETPKQKKDYMKIRLGDFRKIAKCVDFEGGLFEILPEKKMKFKIGDNVEILSAPKPVKAEVKPAEKKRK